MGTSQYAWHQYDLAAMKSGDKDNTANPRGRDTSKQSILFWNFAGTLSYTTSFGPSTSTILHQSQRCQTKQMAFMPLSFKDQFQRVSLVHRHLKLKQFLLVYHSRAIMKIMVKVLQRLQSLSLQPSPVSHKSATISRFQALSRCVTIFNSGKSTK